MQHDFKLTHGAAAQLRQDGFQIPNRASGPDIDDIGHQAGPGCSARRHGPVHLLVTVIAWPGDGDVVTRARRRPFWRCVIPLARQTPSQDRQARVLRAPSTLRVVDVS
jgi:hypothetical protein